MYMLKSRKKNTKTKRGGHHLIPIPFIIAGIGYIKSKLYSKKTRKNRKNRKTKRDLNKKSK